MRILRRNTSPAAAAAQTIANAGPVLPLMNASPAPSAVTTSAASAIGSGFRLFREGDAVANPGAPGPAAGPAVGPPKGDDGALASGESIFFPNARSAPLIVATACPSQVMVTNGM